MPSKLAKIRTLLFGPNSILASWTVLGGYSKRMNSIDVSTTSNCLRPLWMLSEPGCQWQHVRDMTDNADSVVSGLCVMYLYIYEFAFLNYKTKSRAHTILSNTICILPFRCVIDFVYLQNLIQIESFQTICPTYQSNWERLLKLTNRIWEAFWIK